MSRRHTRPGVSVSIDTWSRTGNCQDEAPVAPSTASLPDLYRTVQHPQVLPSTVHKDITMKAQVRRHMVVLDGRTEHALPEVQVPPRPPSGGQTSRRLERFSPTATLGCRCGGHAVADRPPVATTMSYVQRAPVTKESLTQLPVAPHGASTGPNESACIFCRGRAARRRIRCFPITTVPEDVGGEAGGLCIGWAGIGAFTSGASTRVGISSASRPWLAHWWERCSWCFRRNRAPAGPRDRRPEWDSARGRQEPVVHEHHQPLGRTDHACRCDRHLHGREHQGTEWARCRRSGCRTLGRPGHLSASPPVTRRAAGRGRRSPGRRRRRPAERDRHGHDDVRLPHDLAGWAGRPTCLEPELVVRPDRPERRHRRGRGVRQGSVRNAPGDVHVLADVAGWYG